MDTSEFKTEVSKLLHSFYKLRDETYKSPTYEKVKQLIIVAEIIANDACLPKYISNENALTREELLVRKGKMEAKLDNPDYKYSVAEIDQYEEAIKILLSGEDRAGFNRILKEIASRQRTWLVPVSVTNGIGYYFNRSKNINTPLEQLLEDLTFGKDLLSNPKVVDNRKGSKFIENGKPTTTRYVHLQLESIRNRIDKIKREKTNLENLNPPFQWIKEAVKLEHFAANNIESWAKVIVTKLDEEDSGLLKDFTIDEKDLNQCKGPEDYFNNLGTPYNIWGYSFYKQRNRVGGGKFLTYIGKEIRGILKKIT